MSSEILPVHDDAEFKQDGVESGLKLQPEVTTTGGIQQKTESTDDALVKMENGGALNSRDDASTGVALNNQIDEKPLRLRTFLFMKNRIPEMFRNARKKIVINRKLKCLLLLAAMQNVYQVRCSDEVNTIKGKTLLAINLAAFLLMLYGFLMPTRAGGRIAMALGVSFVAAAYLGTLSFVI